MKRNFIIPSLTLCISVLCLVLVLTKNNRDGEYVYSQSTPISNVSFNQSQFPDFTYAAENSIKGVVFVKVVGEQNYGNGGQSDLLEYFFGFRAPSSPQMRVNSGSGVIISSDGYIVTNNHVVEGGKEIEVTLTNNKTFSAKMVGNDPVTDIALLKIDAENLPKLNFGDSDALRLGEWVLAIGSPYNLRSTVTAGIVSAKGRSMPDMSGEYKIESFIQTDAAVNPGNSGGALVNTKGEVIGINTAIASNTGAYAGYSFAVPSSIVQKVVNDIIEFGTVQRAMLGVSMTELTDKLAQEAGIEGDFSGVYVAEALRNGAAYEAGIRDGDIIISIDGTQIKSPAELQEKISLYQPNDKVKVVIVRDGAEKDYTAKLKGRAGTSRLSDDGESVEIFGATLREAPETILEKLRINRGVQVVELSNGKFKDAGVKEGLIITYVNQTPVGSAQQLLDIISNAQRGVLIEGVYENGETFYYGIGV